MINTEMPSELPILPVRNIVLFPGVVWPILLGRASSMKLVRQAEKTGEIIGVVCQRDPDIEVPTNGDLFEYGVSAKIVKQFTLPGGNTTVIVQAQSRFRLNKLTRENPFLKGDVTPMPDLHPDKHDKEWKTAADDLRHLAEEYISMVDEMSDEATFAIRNIHNDEMMLSFVCANMPFTIQEKIKLLGVETVKERLFGAMKAMNREINLQKLKTDIRNRPARILTNSRRTISCSSRSRTCRQRWATNNSLRKQNCCVKPETKNGPRTSHAHSTKRPTSWTTCSLRVLTSTCS
jgi:ATP-dependent Lon protease